MPPASDGFATGRPLLGDLGSRGVVDRGCIRTASHQTVGERRKLAACTCGCDLVGQREMQEYVGYIPPDTRRRTLPVIVGTAVDQHRQLGVLGSQRGEEIVHAARLRRRPHGFHPEPRRSVRKLQGRADVLNVPLLENHPLAPRLGDEW